MDMALGKPRDRSRGDGDSEKPPHLDGQSQSRAVGEASQEATSPLATCSLSADLRVHRKRGRERGSTYTSPYCPRTVSKLAYLRKSTPILAWPGLPAPTTEF